MRKRCLGILLLGLSLMFSSLFYSCDVSQEPAYAGRWVMMDSSMFKTKDSLVRKTTYELGESRYTITYSSINDTAKAFIDSIRISGNLSVLAERMDLLASEFSIIPKGEKAFVSFKTGDADYKKKAEESLIDTLKTYKFRVTTGKMTLKIGEKELYLHRE